MLAHGMLDVEHLYAECVALQVHNLSGPIHVTDAEGEPAMPGDILVVEICDLGALEGDEWGFTGIFDRENGAYFDPIALPPAIVCKSCSCLCSAECLHFRCAHIAGSAAHCPAVS